MQWCKKKGKGAVKMRVFAQRCNQCPESPFATPEFTWDNISRILNNLLFRILKKCYKEGFKQMGEIPLVGDTSLEGPHDSSNCEACLLGFCAQNDLGLASKPPGPPLSPTSSKSTREPKVTAARSNIPCSESSSKVEKPQASKVNPQASNPTKDDPEVGRTSKPSTTPRLTVQQLSVVSSPIPRCVTEMPSSVKSSRAADIANKNTRSKTPKALLSSSPYVPPTSSSYVPLTSSSYVLPTSSSYAPPTSSSYVLPTSFSYVLPTSSSYTPPISSSYVPPTSSSYVPLTSSSYVPPTSSSYVPPTSSSYVLPTSFSYAPPTSSSHVPPTSSSYVPPTSSYVVPTSSYVLPTSSSSAAPNSWGPPANTTRQVERSSHIHSQSESSCCKACCEGIEDCCRCCCECYCACCQGCCNCMSQSPGCSFIVLIIIVVVVVLVIKYDI